MLVSLPYLPPPKPASITLVAGYQIVHWRHDDMGRVYVKNARGQVVAQLHDFDANLDRVIPKGPDGNPEVVLTTWTGGAHGSIGYYVIRLSDKPSCMLAYWKDNDGLEDDFKFESLHGRPYTKILSWYDGLTTHRMYLPIVMAYENGKFVEASAHFPRLLRQRAHRALDELAQTLREPISPDSDPSSEGGKDRLTRFRCIEFLVPKIILGEEINGWSTLKRLIPARVYRELQNHRSWISGITEYRKKLVRHPKLSQIPLIWKYPVKLEAPWD